MLIAAIKVTGGSMRAPHSTSFALWSSGLIFGVKVGWPAASDMFTGVQRRQLRFASRQWLLYRAG